MRIEWTENAVKDLESIYNYIATDSETYASGFVEKIIVSVEKLGNMPEIGRVVNEADDLNVREIIFQNFRIIYRIKSQIVQIIAIIRGSRDLSSLAIKPWEIV
jgi:toxin ParE1/3/4